MNIPGGASVEKLDDNNYEVWKLQIRSLLILNELWPCVSGDEEVPVDAIAKKKWLTQDGKALAIISLTLKENQLTYVKKAKTAKEAWDILEKVHQSKGPAKKVMLYKQLFLMKKKTDQSMQDHIRMFQNSVDKLEAIGISIPKELLSIMLLNTLPEEFENFCIAIESRDDIPDTDILKVKIIEEENRRRNQLDERDSSTPQDALYSDYKHRNEPNKKRNSTNQRKSPAHSSTKTNQFRGNCFTCGKQGHKSNECSKYKRKIQKRKEEAMTAVLNTQVKCSEWYLDSGASAHMCNNPDLFTQMKSNLRCNIHTADNNTVEAYGSGTIKLNFEHFKRVTLNDVLYAPKLKHNLLSVSKATENGYKIVFNKTNAIVKNKYGEYVFEAKLQDKLYVIKDRHHTSLQTSELCNSELVKWHQRLGHLNFNDVVKLQRNNLANGFKTELELNKVKCVVCDKAKINQLPFSKSESKYDDILETVHSDICGPLSEKSIGGARYFVSFIDGKSRYMEVAFLKNRSDVFRAFENYQRFVERQTGKKIKCLRTDNAREYTSTVFNTYLAKNGVKRQFSVEYTPQQNGIAERANRTILEMARSMLIGADLPKCLWAEAVNTAVFTRNRCPSSATGNKTPFELWTAKKPYIGFFRSFGCKVIALEKGPNKSKLDAKGREYIFVGYSNESKAYRLWDGKRSVIKRRDVRFFEKLDKNNYLFFENMLPDSVGVAGIEEELKIESNCEESKSNEKSYIEKNDKIETSQKNMDMQPIEIQNEVDEDAQIQEIMSSSNNTIYNEQTSESNKTSEFYGFSDENLEICNEEKEAVDNNNENNQKQSNRGRRKIERTGKRGRPRKIPRNQVNLVTSECHNNPLSFEDAMSSEEKEKWTQAINTELDSLKKNNTWKIVDRPKNKKVLTSKWVFCKKKDSDGTFRKFKARLVARGCEQQSGIDFNEVYAPVARYETLRTLFALCAEKEMYLHQMDVVTAYVQGELEEELYMEIPRQPNVEQETSKVCKLQKPLYGLKQSGRQWYKKLSTYLKSIGLKPTSADQCLYVNHENDKTIIILIYVDDLLIVSNNLELLKETKKKLSEEFEMKDLGEAHNILGITVDRESSTGKIKISQKQYIEKLLIDFNMENSKSVSTPMEVNQKLLHDLPQMNQEEERRMEKTPYRELMGALTYLSNTVRPDIAFSTNLLSRFNVQPRELHWNAAKRILRYLKGTKDYGISYCKTGEDPKCYVDADWANDVENRRSCTGYTIIIAGGSVCWKSQKQRSVALSTMEAEYIALSEACRETKYLRKLMMELGFDTYCQKETTICCDNQSAIKLSKNLDDHSRSKHIDIRYHFSREMQVTKQIRVEYVPTTEMIADILTKALQKLKHERCVEMLGLLN